MKLVVKLNGGNLPNPIRGTKCFGPMPMATRLKKVLSYRRKNIKVTLPTFRI